ncbi:MAG: TraI domain-containing protein [Kiritimatiellae bacterium]|nr:TraI domain-containing protein [Kiritimatiellia bacterium]
MTPEEIDSLKKQYCAILLGTQRPGMENVLTQLEALGFFSAPASTRFHGAEPGGLLLHSLNVYQEAVVIRMMQIKFRPEIEAQVPEASVAIAALLHDVCKAEVYRQEIRHRKNANGKWEDYLGYTADYSSFPMGHGEKSVVQLLRWGLDLTDAEMLAIRWHMGAFNLPFHCAEESNSLSSAKEKSPLVSIISAADELATYLLENREGKK